MVMFSVPGCQVHPDAGPDVLRSAEAPPFTANPPLPGALPFPPKQLALGRQADVLKVVSQSQPALL